MALVKPKHYPLFYWRCLDCGWDGLYKPISGKCPYCGKKRIVVVRI